MELNLQAYIPAGTLHVPRPKETVGPDLWSREDLWTWRMFIPGMKDSQPVVNSEQCLPRAVQIEVLTALIREYIWDYISLLQARWINLELCTHGKSSKHASLRVYLLPDDVFRGQVDRSSSYMRAKLRKVIQTLDYSPEAWSGGDLTGRDPLERPRPSQPSDTVAENASLLWLFNNIPSPRPSPDSILDDCSRDVALDILESKVPGLLTTLYPYQRRSVAMMLQREVQPGSSLDPRFAQVKDQRGEDYYLDMVESSILKEPRYYDDVSGGILAEEMGSGKTIICLALILATKDFSTRPPLFAQGVNVPKRRRIASLADMAASCATRNHVHWKHHLQVYKRQSGVELTNCLNVLERNPVHYSAPPPRSSRTTRLGYVPLASKVILVSPGTLVVVPNNLLTQWKHEIRKHTQGLEVFVGTRAAAILPEKQLATYDIVLLSQSCLEAIARENYPSPLTRVHFKRCIVDEGHKLGNSRHSRKSDLLTGLLSLNFTSRWVVTGTPSRGLFGVDLQEANDATADPVGPDQPPVTNSSKKRGALAEMEKNDLERIGSIVAIYLNAHPWAPSALGDGEKQANWADYIYLPRHRRSQSRGSFGCLKRTLNSLIIRHQLNDVNNLLPTVNHKVVVLDGSFQDQLSLNIFSMMVIFNSVQSQRTDMDYFFHPKQRRNLLQLAHNLKQACFFGGSFFTHNEIAKAVETAEGFLREKKIPISAEDEQLLREAIKVGHIAMGNKLRRLSTQFHEIPVSATAFPPGTGQSWSLDGETENPVCTSASLLLALQQLIFEATSDPGALNALLNGQLIQKGLEEREKMLLAQSEEKSPKSSEKPTQTLAGNTKLGEYSPPKKRSHGINRMQDSKSHDAFLGPLEMTKITSTASSKLSYLVDSILKYQDEEKIIVFYENDNVAWYLASMLDVLQIKHLIYAKGLTSHRRAQYVDTFHHNQTFRVLLMDLSQAAFGLDMREASRIYFMSPVLNSQVEAQAIGRVRRISQQKPVSVETLVLKNSIEEVILERKEHMTQAEHRRTKSILDVGPIYDWIINAKIFPLSEGHIENEAQMAPLYTPQYVFGREFGRTVHPDDGLFTEESATGMNGKQNMTQPRQLVVTNGVKRPREAADAVKVAADRDEQTSPSGKKNRLARRVRFMDDSDEETMRT